MLTIFRTREEGLRPHLSHQGLRPEDLDRSLHVICKHVHAHLGSDISKRSRQEMCGSHPELQVSEGMLDRLTS